MHITTNTADMRIAVSPVLGDNIPVAALAVNEHGRISANADKIYKIFFILFLFVFYVFLIF